jgi:homoserine kinase
MIRRRVVRVPASSANLGPGFDTFAAALDLHLELEVTETGTFGVATELPVPVGRENLLVRAFERLAPADGFHFAVRSAIPMSGGLGSSAAAIVAGLAAADHLFELDADLLALATEMEGHPDNVAAALRGGIVVCADGAVVSVVAPPSLEGVIVSPAESVVTSVARSVLPATVPRADAVYNVAHGAMLMLGLARGDLDLVARGLGDRLHQDARAPLFPRSSEVVARAREFGALGATISGAGPAVLLWCAFDQTAAVMAAVQAEAGEWATVLRTPFSPHGVDVREL